jgi:multiple sugar transport system permease protein
VGRTQAAPAQVKKRKISSETLWGYIFLSPQLIGLLVFGLIPLVSVIFLSLVQWDGLSAIQFVGLSNFTNQLGDPDFRTALVNTAYYTLLVVPGGIILALLVALGLNKVRGRDIYRVFYFMPVVTSSVAVSVIWLWLLNGDFGLINAYLHVLFGVHGPNWLTDPHWVIPSLSLVAIWWGLGTNMVLFLAGLQGIPSSYMEASQIDGATRLQTFWNVTLPLLSPTLFFITVITIIGSFQVFDISYVMTGGGPVHASYTLVMHIYTLAFQKFTFGAASAVAVILFIIVLILTLIQFAAQRFWVHYD